MARTRRTASPAPRRHGRLPHATSIGARKSRSTTTATICAHSARCSDNLAAVFKYGSEPWIDPDGAGIEAIIGTVRKCPSGALSYAIDGIEAQPVERAPGITVTKNGPYAVVGNVPLGGQAAGDTRASECYTLCRCGASKNKPFCDGTHWSVDFKDDAN
jgi:uncharacterized Fe-S cluster protein YjdI